MLAINSRFANTAVTNLPVIAVIVVPLHMALRHHALEHHLYLSMYWCSKVTRLQFVDTSPQEVVPRAAKQLNILCRLPAGVAYVRPDPLSVVQWPVEGLVLDDDLSQHAAQDNMAL